MTFVAQRIIVCLLYIKFLFQIQELGWSCYIMYVIYYSLLFFLIIFTNKINKHPPKLCGSVGKFLHFNCEVLSSNPTAAYVKSITYCIISNKVPQTWTHIVKATVAKHMLITYIRGVKFNSWRATALQSLAPTLIKHTWSN